MSRRREQGVFDANRGALFAVRTLVSRFSGSAGLTHDQQLKLELVLEELVSNTLEHGRLDPGARISVELLREMDTVVAYYTDPGVPFDPRVARERCADAGFDPRSADCLGLCLIQGMCSSITYAREEGHNRLRLTVELQGGTGPVQPLASSAPA